MGESPRAEADHVSPGQRSTIRRAIQDAIDAHGIEWAMRNTCAELEEKYRITYDTIEYLLSDELPAALPEELLTTGKRIGFEESSTPRCLSHMVKELSQALRRSRRRPIEQQQERRLKYEKIHGAP
jgi:hypothetical protein